MTPSFLDTPPKARLDDVIQEVRANREAYAAQFGYDVRAILRRSRARAAADGREVTNREPRRLDRGSA